MQKITTREKSPIESKAVCTHDCDNMHICCASSNQTRFQQGREKTQIQPLAKELLIVSRC